MSIIHGLSILLRSMPVHPLINPADDLKDKRSYALKLYDEEFFRRAYLREYRHYSENEAANIYRNLQQTVKQSETGGYGIFSLVLFLAEHVLSEEGTTVLCRHEEIVSWREAVHGIGQSIFICAYAAWQDLKRNSKRTYFEFNPFAKTDNIRLRNMLSNGMAENHFHLKGSSPVFLLSWICLMNHITNRKSEFDSIKMQRNFFGFEKEDSGVSLQEWVTKAAAIRLFLIKLLYSENVEEKNELNKSEKEGYVEEKNGLNESEKEEYVEFDPMKIIEGDSKLLPGSIIDLQAAIDAKRFLYPASLDYMTDTRKSAGTYASVAGENIFLYQVFYAIFDRNPKIMKYIDLVYAYLLIFTKMRRELIQCNNAVGFHNFSLYEGRKEIFIEKYRHYSDALITMAHCSVLDNPSVKILEARVVPKKSRKDIIKAMDNTYKLVNRSTPLRCSGCRDYDKVIQKCDAPKGYCRKYLDRMAYVFHLVKQPDKLYKDKFIAGQRYRHYKYIQEIVDPSVNAIIEWREKGSETAAYVYGIDACNAEIGCRPEVFAPGFRRLRAAGNCRSNDCLKANKIPILRVTYHVGEDFLDIADGLRAIDEAVQFLELRHGDRLGHAIALGIDAEEWYEFKGGLVVLPRQDLLDNAVWLYMKLHKLGLSEHELSHELCEVFRTNFNYIFRSTLPYTEHDHDITIEAYYDSWQLRGDHPKYYKDYRQKGFADNISGTQGDLRSKFEYEQIRQENWQACFLMHHYHYNPQVKAKGAETTEYRVSGRYIRAVICIQKEMQKEIALRGIAIETNPSSNYLIGTFKKYEKHPLIAFNDRGLCAIEKQPQLFVSINTDDKGVFDTDLENEYALMANALETYVDSEGNCPYKPADVYHWLDNIRRMGLEQCFKQSEDLEKGD